MDGMRVSMEIASHSRHVCAAKLQLQPGQEIADEQQTQFDSEQKM